MLGVCIMVRQNKIFFLLLTYRIMTHKKYYKHSTTTKRAAANGAKLTIFEVDCSLIIETNNTH